MQSNSVLKSPVHGGIESTLGLTNILRALLMDLCATHSQHRLDPLQFTKTFPCEHVHCYGVQIGTGSLHDSVPSEWVLCPTPPSPVWVVPVGHWAACILLCWCFHQHGPKQHFSTAIPNTLLLLCHLELTSILPCTTVQSLYQHSGRHRFCRSQN